MSYIIVFKNELNDSNVKTIAIQLIDNERKNKTLAKGFVQRSSICEGSEFIDCPARYKCPFENMLSKLRTKAEN